MHEPDSDRREPSRYGMLGSSIDEIGSCAISYLERQSFEILEGYAEIEKVWAGTAVRLLCSKFTSIISIIAKVPQLQTIKCQLVSQLSRGEIRFRTRSSFEHSVLVTEKTSIATTNVWPVRHLNAFQIASCSRLTRAILYSLANDLVSSGRCLCSAMAQDGSRLQHKLNIFSRKDWSWIQSRKQQGGREDRMAAPCTRPRLQHASYMSLKYFHFQGTIPEANV